MPLMVRSSRGGRRRAGGSRGRAGFRGPFPFYSRQTRRGSRVTVTGCCLPIPLALSIATVLAGRALMHR